eukprot:scaffold88239_cov16-Tisochrysis_lutea.AAC.1
MAIEYEKSATAAGIPRKSQGVLSHLRVLRCFTPQSQAFESGLMEYGLIRGAKLPDGSMTWSQQEAQKEPVAASQ